MFHALGDELKAEGALADPRAAGNERDASLGHSSAEQLVEALNTGRQAVRRSRGRAAAAARFQVVARENRDPALPMTMLCRPFKWAVFRSLYTSR